MHRLAPQGALGNFWGRLGGKKIFEVPIPKENAQNAEKNKKTPKASQDLRIGNHSRGV